MLVRQAVGEYAHPTLYAAEPLGAATNSPGEIGRRAAEWSLANQMQSLNYQNVCTAYGILKVAAATGDGKLRRGVEAAFKEYLEGADPNRDNATLPPHRWFGIIPLELYRQTKNPAYLRRGLELAERQYADAGADGLPGYTPRWFVDDIYGATTMQSLAYACTEEEKYLDRAVRQVLTYVQKLQQENGLFYHGTEAKFFWGRGNGWCAAAFAELLGVMPPAHPKREAVLAAYRRMMEGLLARQSQEGMWRQLVDDPQSWPESSCTGMFLFALGEGVKSGWLAKEKYGPAVTKGWAALAGYVDDRGRLREVCLGTNHGKTAQHYLDRPRQTGDAHGQAGLLWGAAGVMKWGGGEVMPGAYNPHKD
jgi:rhamnogalacturonyl hydrolase YesR